MSELVTTALGDTVAFDLRGTGPAVVFVAGAGPHRAVDPTTTETAELAAQRGVRTAVPDRLGRGESAAAGRIDLARELAALRAVIDAAGGSAVLVGHSSGCAIALAAAAAGLPVTGLVLFEAPFTLSGEEVRAWIGEFERLLDAGDLDGALAQYMRDMPPEWLDGARRDPSYRQVVDGVVSYRADGEALVWTGSAPWARLLRPIAVPVLTLVGAETFPGMAEAAAAVAAAAPRGDTGVVAGRNHIWDAAAMAESLVEFTLASAR
jgi:pimeloyl-ACP methyl ester carboxylesterase